MRFRRSHLNPVLILLAAAVAGYLLLHRPSQRVTLPTGPAGSPSAVPERRLDIVTLLPRDAIPAIDEPRFYISAEADVEYAPDELVLGVSLGGESRAYSTALLSRHEVVNDTVGGHKIAVTW